MVSRLSMVGIIEPGRTMNVVAPFAASVKEKRFAYGQLIEKGQALLILDGLDVEMRLRDAESALLKAVQKLEEVKNWAGGAEVSRAQRQLASAKREADQADRRVLDAKPLIERGVIPRQEYEDLQRQAESHTISLAAAREELATTLKRGDTAAWRTAELEHANAKAKVEELKGQLARAVVTAPVSGVVLHAPSMNSGSPGATAIEVGSALSGNQILFTIADLTVLMVSVRVDEMDINHLRVGQLVDVNGDAFSESPLKGRIAWIAQQGTVENGSVAATFVVRVELPPLTEAQRRRIRVGMSANVSITVNESEASVVVPPGVASGLAPHWD
ncbi:ABC transporter, RND-adapter-like protein [Azospirillum argentinense]|uniref:HlyD family secretion protein n=1 Tax=Azospirillum argentinense TaxID=2970906 RepID=UPI0032DFCE65